MRGTRRERRDGAGPAEPLPGLRRAERPHAAHALEVRSDPSDRGLSQGWQHSRCTGAAVGVPNAIDAGDYTGAAGARNFEGSDAWYCTKYTAQAAGIYALSFQSASYRAQVFIDGRSLGSHVGPYLPFELRAPLSAGPHTITVRIDWRKPALQTSEGFHRTWFNWGGINGPVTIRPVGASELSGPTIQTSVTAAGGAVVKVGVLVTNHAAARTIVPEGTLSRGSQTIALPFAPVALGRRAVGDRDRDRAHRPARALVAVQPQPVQPRPVVRDRGRLQRRVSACARSPGDRAACCSTGGSCTCTARASRRTRAGHGDALTASDEETIVSELKSIGANAARSQHPLGPALLERLDAAGILVWQGVGPVEGAGNWFSSTPRLLASAESQARTAVMAERLHPSVFAWNLVNEVAGNGANSYEVKYVQAMAHWVHQTDPGRLVAVDVWGDHPPSSAGGLYSQVDAVAETDYSGWYDSPLDTPAQLAALIRSRLALMDRTFAGKVLAISEFGAESNTLNPSGSPGGYSFQSRVLAAHIAAYRADPHLSAMLVWVLRDYPLVPSFEGGSIHSKLPHVKLIEGINQKGLFTYGGRAKPAAAVVARLYRSIPGE